MHLDRRFIVPQFAGRTFHRRRRRPALCTWRRRGVVFVRWRHLCRLVSGRMRTWPVPNQPPQRPHSAMSRQRLRLIATASVLLSLLILAGNRQPSRRSDPAASRRRDRILCWIVTMPRNVAKAEAVKRTWGRKCDRLIFVSSQNGACLFRFCFVFRAVTFGNANRWLLRHRNVSAGRRTTDRRRVEREAVGEGQTDAAPRLRQLPRRLRLVLQSRRRHVRNR